MSKTCPACGKRVVPRCCFCCCAAAGELRRCCELRELHLEGNRLTTLLLDLTHATALASLQVSAPPSLLMLLLLPPPLLLSFCCCHSSVPDAVAAAVCTHNLSAPALFHLVLLLSVHSSTPCLIFTSTHTHSYMAIPWNTCRNWARRQHFEVSAWPTYVSWQTRDSNGA
jgi:hypothetical protein